MKKQKILVKGDMSGIQDYIFNVKSDGAAQKLRERSLNILKITNDKLVLISNRLELKTELEGGGNFLLEGQWNNNTEKDFYDIKAAIESQMAHQKLKLILSFIRYDEESESNQYSKLLEKLSQQSNLDKLKFGSLNNFENIFSAKPPLEIKKEKNRSVDFVPKWEKLKQPKLKRLSQNSTGIIDFDYLAKFAEKRTGTPYLSALKLDVDNLGKIFQKLDDKAKVRSLSDCLSLFFESSEGNLKQLIQNGTWKDNDDQQHFFSDNIYLVFSGGDDTFILGGYDAVWEFTLQLHKEFQKFSENIKGNINNIRLTFSASYNVFHPKFPVSKVVATAEKSLDQVKHTCYPNENEPEKNKISILGEIFFWEDFERINEITRQLTKLITHKGENKALLNRIKLSYKGFNAAEKNFEQGELSIQKVWNLFYFLRNVKNENRDEAEQLMKHYESLILSDYLENKKTNAMMFPVSARMSEFYTKNYLNQDSYGE